MSDYVETPAPTPPTEQGGVWRTCQLGAGPHAVADLVLIGDGGRRNQLVCRCGQRLGAAPYTTGYRYGTTEPASRRDILRQHQRREAGLCVYCGERSCWCAVTVGS